MQHTFEQFAHNDDRADAIERTDMLWSIHCQYQYCLPV